ncbi:MAG TPA: DUF6526 family protein [Thermoanaerobaculia bacterium]|nr:DUF6526 family protein [Thermoanaerobaculia bacterium]
MPAEPQTYANHVRMDPSYHYFLSGVLAANILLRIWWAIRGFSFATAWEVLVALALGVLAWKVRTYPLAAQDRVIRLEERLRLAGLLPEPLRGRIGELSMRQLVALRFASDAEVPALVEKALAGAPPADIKRAITSWRADTYRV